jgi:hypothetical protein
MSCTEPGIEPCKDLFMPYELPPYNVLRFSVYGYGIWALIKSFAVQKPSMITAASLLSTL